MSAAPARWREAVEHGRILWRAHAVGRMLQRSISRSDVVQVLAEYDVVEHYPEDEPCPSALLVGRCGSRALHVVAAFDATFDRVCVITAYEPDLEHFEEGFRRRRQL
jgi:hypothetical protein